MHKFSEPCSTAIDLDGHLDCYVSGQVGEKSPVWAAHLYPMEKHLHLGKALSQTKHFPRWMFLSILEKGQRAWVIFQVLTTTHLHPTLGLNKPSSTDEDSVHVCTHYLPCPIHHIHHKPRSTSHRLDHLLASHLPTAPILTWRNVLCCGCFRGFVLEQNYAPSPPGEVLEGDGPASVLLVVSAT